MILHHANRRISSSDATDEEKAAARQSLLNARATRWRSVFFEWPRDPKGKSITPENSVPGKMAPNKAQLWGATLFDFYSVRRFPDVMSLITFSSGSKLAAWMKANGEDYAKSQLKLADSEEDPHMVLPYEITGLIQEGDVTGMFDRSWIRDDDNDSTGEKRKSKGKEKKREDWQVLQPVCLLDRPFFAHIHSNCPVASCFPLRPPFVS